MIYPIDRQDIPAYAERCTQRQNKLIEVTMNFVKYFMELGDDRVASETKVSEVSTEVAPYLYAYVFGNKTPLLDTINLCKLPFMDVTTKEFLIEQLS